MFGSSVSQIKIVYLDVFGLDAAMTPSHERVTQRHDTVSQAHVTVSLSFKITLSLSSLTF